MGAIGLEWLDYRLLVRSRSTDLYILLVALAFLASGIYIGRRLLTHTSTPEPFDGNPQARESLGISPRELVVLQAVASGKSNKEIAAELSVSPNTVKTHVARLFEKLGAKRRTEAINRARQLGIIR
ncbi:MAG TPA: response regulator transcription factor [Steroidobacteraceae bacterium]|nr:response regulator transcription factor [Steroidobacteraceae bacterium]